MMKKLQNIVVPFCLALVLVLGVRGLISFWGGSKSTEEAGIADFVVPATRQEIKPLNVEIDFIDTKLYAKETLSKVDVQWGELVFSTNGASLDQLVFKRFVNGAVQEIPVIFPVAQTDKEKRCFIVGLAEKTPYYYDLIERIDAQDTVELRYKAVTSEVEIYKTFVIHNQIHKIDLKLELVPKQAGAERGIEPRILFSSPYVSSLGEKDAISGVVIDQNDLFNKKSYETLDMQRGWYKPILFGADDKYFVHVLVGDLQHFTQRAYYKSINNKMLMSIIEGPTIQEPYFCSLSFYFGPKEGKAFGAVDNRLKKIFGYSGFLAPVSRILLYSLQWLYRYLGSYGWAIIALIILLQLLMLPFTLRGEKSTKKAKEYQKKMAYIQQRYKHDREALARERAELIQKNGMPGLGGCLPILLFRMPVFFALSQVLNNAIELYGAPFLWIKDLSASDPYYIFPLFVVGGMIAQASTVESEQRIQFLLLALVVGWFTTTLAAGLALYITVSTFLGIVQTSLVRFFKIV